MHPQSDSTAFRTNWVTLAYRQLSISELVSRALNGDPEAFVALICRKYPLVVSTCRTALDQSSMVEDVVQEVFVELWRQRTKIRSPEAIDGWLVQTARNISLRNLSRETKCRSVRLELLLSDPGQSKEEDEPVRATIRKETVASIQKVIAELTDADQRVLREQETTENDSGAADSLGLKLPAYRVRLHRARRRLRDLLIKYGVVPAAGFALFHGDRKVRATAFLATLWSSTSGPVKVAGLAILLLTCAVAGSLWMKSSPPPPQVVVASSRIETLQERNRRAVTDELVDQLLKNVQKFYPSDNPLRLAGVRTVGSIVEVEFQTDRPPPRAAGLPTRIRASYCTFRRRLDVEMQAVGSNRYSLMNPDKPLPRIVTLPFGGSVEIVLGRTEFAASKKLLDQLPMDSRAEAELIRQLFGPPGSDLMIPADRFGGSGFGDNLIVATGRSLFVRGPDCQWRYAGECTGWFPVVADSRVYCTMKGIIRSRPLADLNAPWEAVCPEPPLQKGEKAEQLFVVGNQVCQVVLGHGFATRPLNDPNAQWTKIRTDYVPFPSGLAVAGDVILMVNGDHLLARPAADHRAAPEIVVKLPAPCAQVMTYGDRLLVFDGAGPVYARPLRAGPEVPWVVVGQIRSQPR